MSEQLERMMEMADQLLLTQDRVKALVDELSEAKSELTRLEQEDLPELMREVGFTSFTVKDGRVIELVDEISCGITEENRPAAMAWLDDNGFGGLIKTKLEVVFNREDRAVAIKLADRMADEAEREEVIIDREVVENVHAATLKKFIKEEMEKGKTVPADLFSVHPYSKVKIKQGKK